MSLEIVWLGWVVVSFDGLCVACAALPVKQDSHAINSLSVMFSAVSSRNNLCLDTLWSFLMGA